MHLRSLAISVIVGAISLQLAWSQGTFWLPMGGPLANQDVRILASNSQGHLYAGTWTHGEVYKSTNNGDSWIVCSPLPNPNPVLGLSIDTHGHIFASIWQCGIARSTDGGMSWQMKNNGLTTFTVRRSLVNKAGHVWLATEAGIFRSTDDGENWILMTQAYTGGLYQDSTGAIVSGDSYNLIRSTDDGTTWSRKPMNTAIICGIHSDGSYYGWNTLSQIFRSTDFGTTWNDLHSPDSQTGPVTDMLFTPEGDAFIARSGNAAGVLHTADNGANWHLENSGLTTTTLGPLYRTPNGFLFLGTGGAGVFRSAQFSRSPAQFNWTNDPNNPRLSDGRLTLEPAVLYDAASERYDLWYYDLSNVKRAVSSDGVNWTTTGNVQSLTTLFSTSMIGCGEVYRVGSTYYMYPGCKGQDGTSWYLGLASSVDGNVWTKHPSSPALTKGEAGSWDGTLVNGSRVTEKDGIYYMYYGGNGAVGTQIGLATSADGVHWEKYGGNPVVGAKALGPKTNTVGVVGVAAVNGLFYMVVSVKDSLDRTTYNMATSSDGRSWSFYEGNPILKTGNPGTWNAGGIGGGALRYVAGKFWLWYCGCDYSQTWRVGLATSDPVVPQDILVSAPQVITASGAIQEIPIMVTNVTGKGILAYDFTLSFNSPDSMLAVDATAITAGTLTGQNGWSVLVNTASPNRVHVAAYGATPLSGGGTLMKLKVRTSPSAQVGDSSSLTIAQFLFNTGNPAATLQHGSIVIRERVCGDADESGEVQAYDAALTLRDALGPMSPPPAPLTSMGRLNADVSMDGKVQAYDAALILRHVVGLPMPESTATCFGGGVAGTLRTFALAGKVNSAQYSAGQWLAQVSLAEVPGNMQVLSCSFELTTSPYGDDVPGLTLPQLAQGYLATINPLGNGRFKVGIINPNGVDVAGIPLTLSARYPSSINTIVINDLYLNDAPNASAITVANIFTSVTEPQAPVHPESFELTGAYPNPFNPSTRIVFKTPKSTEVTLEMYNAQGVRVKVLLHEQVSAGQHEVSWNGTNSLGQIVATGEYFCVMRAGSFMKSTRVLLIK